MTMYSSIITRRGVLVGITASGIASPSLKGGTSSKRLAWPDKPTLPIRCDTRTFLGRAIARPSLGRGEIALPSKSLFAVALALAPLSTGDAHDIYDGSLSRTRPSSTSISGTRDRFDCGHLGRRSPLRMFSCCALRRPLNARRAHRPPGNFDWPNRSCEMSIHA